MNDWASEQAMNHFNACVTDVALVMMRPSTRLRPIVKQRNETSFYCVYNDYAYGQGATPGEALAAFDKLFADPR